MELRTQCNEDLKDLTSQYDSDRTSWVSTRAKLETDHAKQVVVKISTFVRVT